MSTSQAFTDQLARAYREARVLVLGDRTPKVDRAFALHREFLAIRASYVMEQDGSASEWEATLLERTRRAIIVALRRQAVAIRERWSESRGSLDIEQSSPHADLEHALQLSTAAMQLHVDGDRDASRTAQVVEYLRQTLAQVDLLAPPPLPAPEPPRPMPTSTTAEASDTAAAAVAGAASVLPGTPSAVVTAPEMDSPPEPVMAAGPGEAMGPPNVGETSPIPSRSPRGRSRLALLTAAGFVFVIGLVTAFWRIGTVGPIVNNGGDKARPSDGVAAAAPTPAPSPSAARVATVLLKSDPSGAQVTVGGDLRGITPLNIEGKPGESLSVVMQKGNRVWRGVLKVGEEDQQTVIIRLPLPRAAQTPRPQPTTVARRSSQTRFDATLREGIDLYKNGWFGPAAARFREAATIDPKSPQAYLWLGRALMRSDRQTEARRALEKVLELEKTGPEAEEAAVLLSRFP